MAVWRYVESDKVAQKGSHVALIFGGHVFVVFEKMESLEEGQGIGDGDWTIGENEGILNFGG